MSAEMMLLAVVAALAVGAGIGTWVHAAISHVKDRRRREELARRLAQRPLDTRFRARKYR